VNSVYLKAQKTKYLDEVLIILCNKARIGVI